MKNECQKCGKCFINLTQIKFGRGLINFCGITLNMNEIEQFKNKCNLMPKIAYSETRDS